MSIVAVHGPTMLGDGGTTPPPDGGVTATSVEPSTIPEDTPTTITVVGSGFDATCSIYVNLTEYATTFIDENHISAEVVANRGGETTVVVLAGSSGESDTVPLDVEPGPGAPAPVLISVTPNTGEVGGGSVSVVLIGTGFVPESGVTSWSPSGQDSSIGRTVVSDTEIHIVFYLAVDVGVHEIAVTNWVLGDIAMSNKLPFTVTAPTGPPLPEITENFDWQPVMAQGVMMRSASTGGPWAEFPGMYSIVTMSINGTDLGRYKRSTYPEDGTFVQDGTKFTIWKVNYDDVDNKAILEALDNTVATIAWNDPSPAFPLTLAPESVPKYDGLATITATSPGAMEEGMVAEMTNNPSAFTYPCTLVSPDAVTFVIDPLSFADFYDAPFIVRKPDGTASEYAFIEIVGAPAPVLTSVDPVSTSLAAGAMTFDLHGSGFLGGGDYYVQVLINNSTSVGPFVVESDTLISGVAWTPIREGDHTVKVQLNLAAQSASNSLNIMVTA